MLTGCAERGAFTQHGWAYRPVPAIVVNSTGVPLKSKMRGLARWVSVAKMAHWLRGLNVALCTAVDTRSQLSTQPPMKCLLHPSPAEVQNHWKRGVEIL